MKYIAICTLAFYASLSSAVVLWPSSTAPCNTTLQACVTGSPTGETVEIRTSTQINESIVSNNAISLVAGVGYKPVFASGRSIEMAGTSSTDRTVTYSGLTFLRGRIAYSAYGFDDAITTLHIKNNNIIDNSSQYQSIRINNFGNHTLNLNIDFNQINYSAPSTNLDRSGGISMTNGSLSGTPTSGKITGRIFNNQINTDGDESVGIGLYELTGNSSDLDVSSNQFNGGETAALYFVKDTGSTGDSRIDFAHNAIYDSQIDTITRGLKTVVYDGSLEINAINNSVVGVRDGFIFQNAYGGVYDINLYNNLITSTRTPVIINNPNNADLNVNITFDNDNNLFYNNQLNDPDFVAGAAHLTVDPKIKGLTDARLRPGSPAIETADQTALFYIISVPLIDADGLYRIKNGNPGSGGVALDIGAYETGDMRLLDTLKGSSSNENPIESVAINSQEFAKLQITHNWNPLNANGIYNNNNMGVYRAGSKWRIFTQNVSAMDINTAFNVWNPAPSARNYVHKAEDAISATESYTMLDKTGLNNNPNAILSVTQLYGLYNDNPVGVFYNSIDGRWYIYNTNFVDMPWMATFNVYFQDSSANAFEHQAKAANISSNVTYIDHPLLNGTPCAQFQITHKGISNIPYRTGVFYNSSKQRWAIYNEGLEIMPDNARFHVIVSAEQIAACSDVIFKDGFE